VLTEVSLLTCRESVCYTLICSYEVSRRKYRGCWRCNNSLTCPLIKISILQVNRTINRGWLRMRYGAAKVNATVNSCMECVYTAWGTYRISN